MSHPAAIISNVQCVRLALLDNALVKCVVTEDVLFSIVAFKTLTFHKVVSVATHLRCGSIFSDDTITHFLLILAVKNV